MVVVAIFSFFVLETAIWLVDLRVDSVFCLSYVYITAGYITVKQRHTGLHGVHGQDNRSRPVPLGKQYEYAI